MSVAIRKLIARLEKNIVAENDPSKRKSIASSLKAAKETLKHVEHTETKETPDEEESEEGGNETDREEAGEEEEAEEPPAKSKKSKAKAEEPAKDDDEEDDDGEDDEEEEEDEEEAASASGEEEASAALTKLVAQVPGKKGQRLMGHLKALSDKSAMADANDARIAKIERERVGERKEALIHGALHAKGGPRITPADAKWLRGQKFATVKSYLAQRTKPVINTEDIVPETDPRTGASSEFTDFERNSIAQAVAAGANKEKLEANLRTDKAARAAKGGA
jgi:hypothetical protein